MCPSVLKSGIFTTAGVNDIDNNPSSTIPHFSFHGTGISSFQHQKSPTDAIKRQFVIDETIETTSKLLESYITVKHLRTPCMSVYWKKVCIHCQLIAGVMKRKTKKYAILVLVHNSSAKTHYAYLCKVNP